MCNDTDMFGEVERYKGSEVKNSIVVCAIGELWHDVDMVVERTLDESNLILVPVGKLESLRNLKRSLRVELKCDFNRLLLGYDDPNATKESIEEEFIEKVNNIAATDERDMYVVASNTNRWVGKFNSRVKVRKTPNPYISD